VSAWRKGKEDCHAAPSGLWKPPGTRIAPNVVNDTRANLLASVAAYGVLNIHAPAFIASVSPRFHHVAGSIAKADYYVFHLVKMIPQQIAMIM
jgi:hypothetical protein